MQWSPHINMLLQRIVFTDSPSAPLEQYYSTASTVYIYQITASIAHTCIHDQRKNVVYTENMVVYRRKINDASH
jgi:hypothetical protein